MRRLASFAVALLLLLGAAAILNDYWVYVPCPGVPGRLRDARPDPDGRDRRHELVRPDGLRRRRGLCRRARQHDMGAAGSARVRPRSVAAAARRARVRRGDGDVVGPLPAVVDDRLGARHRQFLRQCRGSRRLSGHRQHSAAVWPRRADRGGACARPHRHRLLRPAVAVAEPPRLAPGPRAAGDRHRSRDAGMYGHQHRGAAARGVFARGGLCGAGRVLLRASPALRVAVAVQSRRRPRIHVHGAARRQSKPVGARSPARSS